MNSEKPKENPKKLSPKEVGDIKDKKEKLVKNQITVTK